MAGLASTHRMRIVMQPDAGDDEVAALVERLRAVGADVRVSSVDARVVVEASADPMLQAGAPWEDLPGVEQVVPSVPGGRRVGRGSRPEDTVVRVGSVAIGDGTVVVIAGPCAVESREQMLETAAAVAASGASMLRGDAFKPRTSPYTFQGLGKAGLEILAEARDMTGLPVVAEVLDPRDVDLVASYADMLKIGTRNMSNFPLLREVGRRDVPVMLKRGWGATVEEWIDSAEHVHNEGNGAIVLVERGVRGFDGSARNTLDLTAVPVAKSLTHLPVLVDPSHAAGRADLVAPLARAAVAVGADGVLVDVHPSPETALVDGPQALLPEEFAGLMSEMRAIAAVVGRS